MLNPIQNIAAPAMISIVEIYERNLGLLSF